VLYIPFECEISRNSIEALLTTLRKTDAPQPQGVHIHSPGGEFEFFSELAPAIERRGIVTLTEEARSSAVLLALLGHRRQAMPKATFFFHEVRAFFRVPEAPGQEISMTVSDLDTLFEYEEEVISALKREQIAEWRRRTVSAQDWFVGFMGQKTGLAPGVFRNLMKANATLSAREALRYGIVHEIMPDKRGH
jgi:ATP-dependent protease ClpP protease subunit